MSTRRNNKINSPEKMTWKIVRYYVNGSCNVYRNYRPKWIINPETGRRLELDIYIPKWKLAIEVDGIHHQTISQKKKDAIKTKECASRGIRLFRIRVNGRSFSKQISGLVFGYLFKFSDRKYFPDFLRKQVNTTDKLYQDIKSKNLGPRSPLKVKSNYWRYNRIKIWKEVGKVEQQNETESIRERREARERLSQA